MTDQHARGVGNYALSESQVASWISWMDRECLERKSRELLAELTAARNDFVTEIAWCPNNSYHLADWWEQLAKYYAMRVRAAALDRASELARRGSAA